MISGVRVLLGSRGARGYTPPVVAPPVWATGSSQVDPDQRLPRGEAGASFRFQVVRGSGAQQSLELKQRALALQAQLEVVLALELEFRVEVEGILGGRAA